MKTKLPPSVAANLEDLTIEYERFFSVSIDMLCISSYDGHFKKVNPAFEQVLGYTAEEFCSKSYLDFIHPDDIDVTIKEIEKQMVKRHQVFNFENRYRAKDGSYKWLSWKSAPVGNFMYAVARDVTEQKEIEKQILNTLEREKELSELKSRFVSMASHEFRTPLSGILSSVSLIASYRKPEDESKREKHIQTIKNSVKSLTAILNDFLSMDKLNQGKIEANPSKFSLNELVSEVLTEFSHISDKNQNIIVENKNSEIALYQDREMLKNIIINFVSNAIKYSPDESTINIVTGLENSEMFLQVHDQGIGIPLNDQKHLSELFFRANNVHNVTGTGLGLNSVKRYLNIMGGSFDFKSVENVGSVFIIKLPLEAKI